MTAEGSKVVAKLDQILLNGNNIALLVPGGKPERNRRRFTDRLHNCIRTLSAQHSCLVVANAATSATTTANHQDADAAALPPAGPALTNG